MAHILIAEDDHSMRRFLVLALERAGYRVTACEDGLAAFEALEKSVQEGGDRHDLMLTDIVMPGMDGIELAQKAAIMAPDMKIMFITGFAAVAPTRYNGQYSGQDDTAEPTGIKPDADIPDEKIRNTKVMAKPFHLKDLVDQIEVLLAG